MRSGSISSIPAAAAANSVFISGGMRVLFWYIVGLWWWQWSKIPCSLLWKKNMLARMCLTLNSLFPLPLPLFFLFLSLPFALSGQRKPRRLKRSRHKEYRRLARVFYCVPLNDIPCFLLQQQLKAQQTKQHMKSQKHVMKSQQKMGGRLRWTW